MPSRSHDVEHDTPGSRSIPTRPSAAAALEWTPPSSGPPAHLIEGTARGSTRFLVRYCDEAYAFAADAWARFGRDDDTCEIPIWEEIEGHRLSRVAGVLWSTNGELWVRNLSATHELAVVGPIGGPRWLPRRLADEPGAACTLAGAHGTVSSPTTGTWELVIERVGSHPPTRVAASPSSRTLSLEPVPDRLMSVAAALCAPILLRDEPAATYDEVATTLGVTRRQARRYVDGLCQHYASHEWLREADAPGLVTYARLAHLLVRRGRVTRADLDAHPGEGGRAAEPPGGRA